MANNESLKKDLVQWSEKHKGEKSKLVAQIVAAFDDPELRSRWSLIDIRREFESRSDSHDSKGRWAVLDWAQTGSYLFPIGFTWWHLSGALRSFQQASNSINFISFWTGEYEGFRLQNVGFVVIASLLFTVVISALLSRIELRRLETADSLNDLILQTQLEFSTARTITPEALADALSDSTLKLETALTSMTTAVSSTKETIDAIKNSADGLKNASETSSKLLATSSSKLGEQIKNLDGSFEKIKVVVDKLGTIGENIATAGETIQKINGLTDSATNVDAEIKKAFTSAQTAANTIGIFSTSLKDDISKLGQQLTEQVGSTNDVLIDLVKKISPLISNLKDLAFVTNENKPAILYLGEVVKEIKTLVEEMCRCTSDFVSSVNSNSQEDWNPNGQ